eukprot:TRINITY_DN72246_c0_g1_i1.p1 TRINITY_DN72246_c0_g1~~TRINITY_DN72246_c0_g1_i1.p1  ORF type:complete len:322 (-),score=102.37 TRINITY_DN72246_c0_g1_i1:46-1011(-)
MGKKRKASDSDEDSKKKKKKKGKKDKKKKDKKAKKDKKKKTKEAKKGKKKDSSSSGSDSSSGSGSDENTVGVEKFAAPAASGIELPEPQEGILRFVWEPDEVGPLGLRFSGGCPPMILSVNPGSPAATKGVPVNCEVHAINGLELVGRNRDRVMEGLKSRPVYLDVRPQGWKPPDIAREIKKKKDEMEAERAKMVALEEQRRDKVARDQQEEADRLAKEKKQQQEREKLEREALEKRAREAKNKAQAKEKEFERALARDPAELRKLATAVMEAPYGSDLLQNRRLPLRLFTRRKEVAWLWAGEAQELIGGGAPDMSSWSQA